MSMDVVSSQQLLKSVAGELSALIIDQVHRPWVPCQPCVLEVESNMGGGFVLQSNYLCEISDCVRDGECFEPYGIGANL